MCVHVNIDYTEMAYILYIYIYIYIYKFKSECNDFACSKAQQKMSYDAINFYQTGN